MATTPTAASRLIGQTYTGPSGVLGDLTYSYDATGNRLTTRGSFARSGLPTSIPATSYDGANQQLTFGSVAQTFDANGNLLTQTDATGTTTYTWDARNRLTALTGPTVSATFTYDALGRRTTKTINGQSTSVLYDGLDAVQESGPEGDASYLRTLGIDEALSRTDGNGTLTYLTDALGSTLALADSSGAASTTYTYAPFGETAVSGLPSSSPFQFTGRENDGTGLYYYRARYYDPI
jgi:YD repeat-containing protein